VTISKAKTWRALHSSFTDRPGTRSTLNMQSIPARIVKTPLQCSYVLLGSGMPKTAALTA